MNIKEFKENWGLAAIPTELEKLIYFQTDISSFENYSEGFGVLIDDKTGLKSWSKDTSFLDKLFPFAQANCSGSFYAIWNDGTTKPINQMPIVVFGDEGGVFIVANNILELMQILTLDTEIMAYYDGASFYKDKDYKPRKDHAKYTSWLKDNFNLDSVENEDVEVMIETATKNLKESFDKWFKQYYDAE